MRKFILILLIISILLTPVFNIFNFSFASDLSVTATIPADENDFQLQIASSATSPLQEQKVYSYTITYGSYLNHQINFSIVASWSEDTAEGLDSQITAVEYVHGSASKGEGNISPIIDLTNKTITWEFDSFPAQTTDKTLTFQLKTKSSSLTNKKINFSVSASLNGPGVTVNKSINQYLIIEGTSESTAVPTSTPTPAQRLLPTPSESLDKKKLDFQIVDLRQLTANEVTLFIQTTSASKIKLEYGKTLSFDNIIYRNVSDTKHLLTLANLNEQTKYYFRITIFDDKNEKQSEIYTLKTPKKTELTTIEKNNIIFLSNNIILNNFSLPKTETKQKSDQHKILLPTATDYQIQIPFKNKNQIKKAEVFVRNDSVLGISLFQKVDALSKMHPDTAYGELVQLSDGLYYVRLKVPEEKGIYAVFLRITDIYGNITEEKIGTVIASHPIRIINSQDQKGIEAARAVLSIYDEKRKKYILITPSIISIPNPSYSNYKGEISLVLPPAKYQITINHPEYFEKTVVFAIDSTTTEYPQIQLERKPFDIKFILLNYKETIQSMIINPVQRYLNLITSSQRMLDLTRNLIIIIFILLSIFGFAKRIQISPLALPLFIPQILLAKIKNKSKLKNYLKGKITDDNEHTIPDVNVYLFDTQKNVIDHTLTNKNGLFLLKNIAAGNYILAILKEGYEAFYFSIKIPLTNPVLHLAITQKSPAQTKSEKIKRLLSYSLSLIFEVLIGISFALIILEGLIWGIKTIFPYVLLNSINIVLWIIYQKNKTHNTLF
ncbi:MAG: hypothetical protein KatS3mg089_0883 [Patescibacteria group bacterium]|nr:MAG: hypothetical protein KatS3mg089_0883 [Patescibacteria group bacterium]